MESGDDKLKKDKLILKFRQLMVSPVWHFCQFRIYQSLNAVVQQLPFVDSAHVFVTKIKQRVVVLANMIFFYCNIFNTCNSVVEVSTFNRVLLKNVLVVCAELSSYKNTLIFMLVVV